MLKLPCANKCGVEVTRIRFSCWRCPDRRIAKGKFDFTKYHYNRFFKQWIPNEYRQLSFLRVEDVTNCYILFVDEQRRFKAEKDVLLNWLFKLATRCNDKGLLKFRAKVLSVCENLAS